MLIVNFIIIAVIIMMDSSAGLKIAGPPALKGHDPIAMQEALTNHNDSSLQEALTQTLNIPQAALPTPEVLEEDSDDTTSFEVDSSNGD